MRQQALEPPDVARLEDVVLSDEREPRLPEDARDPVPRPRVEPRQGEVVEVDADAGEDGDAERDERVEVDPRRDERERDADGDEEVVARVDACSPGGRPPPTDKNLRPDGREASSASPGSLGA